LAGPFKITVCDRRSFVLGAGLTAGAAVAGLVAASLKASSQEPPAPRSNGFDEALLKVLGEAVPDENVISFELPELAENGNTVPYRLFVPSEMTDTDYVQTMHLLSTANPQAKVATFHLTPASGRAEVAGRMRLAKTQDVVAVAEVSTGKFLISTRRVEVTIGGCGND
jgi:sulfur-oxidizing protein SoxY